MTEPDDNRLDQDKSEPEAQSSQEQLPSLSETDLLGIRIAELENIVNQYKDQLLRKAAEFENYKKRTENDYGSIVKFSNEELIIKLLPVLDDFERFVKALQKSGDEPGKAGQESAFAKGMELILSKFKNIMEKQGVKHFDVLGKPFDPLIHDALMQIPR